MLTLPYGVFDFLRAPSWTARSLSWRALHPAARLAEPIFLIGAPRSGTTLAVNLFATHPDVASWSEAGRIWDPVHYDDPEAEHFWTAERVTAGHCRRLHRWGEWYRRRQGKKRFINKHPRNSLRIGYLQRVFPDARFIHLIRNGRAVVNSVVSQIEDNAYRQIRPMGGFAKPPGWRTMLRENVTQQSALQWQAIVRSVREQATMLGASYTEVRYETLCADPRRTVGELFEFAGIRADAATLAALPAKLDENKAWRVRLSNEQLNTIDASAGEVLRELGYG